MNVLLRIGSITDWKHQICLEMFARSRSPQIVGVATVSQPGNAAQCAIRLGPDVVRNIGLLDPVAGGRPGHALERVPHHGFFDKGRRSG